MDLLSKLSFFTALHEQFRAVRLQKFQREIVDLVDGQVHDRDIFWYYEETGGVGKTKISKYLVVTRKAIRLENGKSADIKYAYGGEKIVIFDLCRSQQEKTNYEAIEAIKNGFFLNTKYESRMRTFAVPHVLFMPYLCFGIVLNIKGFGY